MDIEIYFEVGKEERVRELINPKHIIQDTGFTTVITDNTGELDKLIKNFDKVARLYKNTLKIKKRNNINNFGLDWEEKPRSYIRKIEEKSIEDLLNEVDIIYKVGY